ncbi:hypothetical protein C8R44DRAFT_889266 [Mycena epipterygia]|nr:hypothetical protein C8R44DRAFT_889266 [Mycena epipterygia]
MHRGPGIKRIVAHGEGLVLIFKVPLSRETQPVTFCAGNPSLHLSLTTSLIDVIPGSVRQSNGIQLSPKNTAIAAGCSSQATVRDSKGSSRGTPHINPRLESLSSGDLPRRRERRDGPALSHDVYANPAHRELCGLDFCGFEGDDVDDESIGGDDVHICADTAFPFSIEPNSGYAILRPVLQERVISTPFLGMDPRLQEEARSGASLPESNQTFFTASVHTSAGATLDGVITPTSSGTSFVYTSSFSNVAGTSLSTTSASQLTYATEMLEVYGVTSASDYPIGLTSSGTSFACTSSFSNTTEAFEAYGLTSASDYPTASSVFSGLNLKLSSGAVPTVARSNVRDTADGLITTVNTNGAAEIAIAFEVEQRQLAAFFWYRSCNVI